MPKLTTQLLVTENEVTLLTDLFKIWEESDLDLEHPLSMNEIFEMKAKLADAHTAFHGNKRGGM